MDKTVIDTPNRARSVQWASTKTPGFYQLRREGKRLPFNMHQAGVSDLTAPTVQTYNGPRTQRQARGERNPGNVWNTGGYISGEANIEKIYTNLPTQSELKEILNNRLLAKVRETPIDLGVALGEYRETANFLASAMVKTVQAAKAVKKGDLSLMAKIISGRHKGSTLFSRKIRGNPDSAELEMQKVILRDTSRWQSVPLSAGGTLLAMNYGLKPLLSDVEGAYNYLSEIYSPNSQSEFHFRTRFPAKSCNISGDNSKSAAGGVATAGCNYQIEVSGRAYARAVIDNPVLYNLDKLGLLNPISTGYELVPFSFVVDWFLPIGDLLRNVPDPKGIRFLEGYRVVKLNGAWREWTKVLSPSPGWVSELNGTQWYKHREVLTAFPEYTLHFSPLDTYRRRIANGSALLSNFLFAEDPTVKQPTRKDFKLLEPLGIKRSEFRRIQRLYR